MPESEKKSERFLTTEVEEVKENKEGQVNSSVLAFLEEGLSPIERKHSLLKQEHWENHKASIKETFSHRMSQLVKNSVKKLTDKYDIGPELGKGQFGMVHKCWLKSESSIAETSKTLAMKSIEKKRHSKGTFASLLKNELVILPKAEHPNIVTIFEIFQDQSNYYVVQELMQGGNLKEQISNQGMFSEAKVINIVRQLCEALKYLHQHNIVHRDIKSENLLLEKSVYACNDYDVVIKLADFGMASYVDPEKGLQLFCGTDQYMAPEIIRQGSNKDIEQKYLDRNLAYNTRIDIWALGCITYELFNKVTPFMGTSYKQIHMAILHDSPDFTKNQFLSDSKHAQDFINQCLTKDMTARPNASDLLSHPWLTKQSRKSVYQPKRSTFVGQITDDATKMIYAHNKLIEILGWVKLSQEKSKDIIRTFTNLDSDNTGSL